MQMPWDQRYKEGPTMKDNENGGYEEDDTCDECGNPTDDCTCDTDEDE